MLRVPKRATRSSTPTSSTGVTRSSTGRWGVQGLTASCMFGLCEVEKRGLKGELDHLIERTLALVRRQRPAAVDLIAHGADRKGFGTKLSGEGVDPRGFHFDADDIVLLHHLEHFRLGRVEEVGREEVADLHRDLPCLCHPRALAQQPKAREGGEIIAPEAHAIHARVGRGAHGNDDVVELHRRENTPAAAHAYHALDLELGQQFMAIKRGGGNPDAVGLQGDRSTAILAREPVHIAHVIDTPGVLQVTLSDVLSAQRIAGHEDGARVVTILGVEVLGCHGLVPQCSHGREMDAGSARWLRFRGRADCTQDGVRIVLDAVWPFLDSAMSYWVYSRPLSTHARVACRIPWGEG